MKLESSASMSTQRPDEILFDWMKLESSASASALIDNAGQLLDQVESLEEFKERLIDLFAATDPEQLAETMARLEMLANMAGRLEASDE
jgi:uncharacterized protein YfdQ (DUF2303 family)